MATFLVRDGFLELHFSKWEVLGALANGARVPVSDIHRIEVVADPWKVVSGMRVGTGLPWVILLGTMMWKGPSDVVAIYRRRPAIVVTLKPGAAYQRLIATVPCPELIAEELRRAARMPDDGLIRTEAERPSSL